MSTGSFPLHELPLELLEYFALLVHPKHLGTTEIVALASLCKKMRDNLRVLQLPICSTSASALPQPGQKVASEDALFLVGYVKLSGASIESLTGLASFSKLHTLELTMCPEVTDLSPLSSCCPRLRSLKVRKCDKVTDVSALHGCTNLEDLTLHSLPIEDVSALGGCKGLRNLSISDCKKLLSIGGLEKCKELYSLFLEECPLLLDLSPLNKLSRLCTLQVTHCRGTPVLAQLPESVDSVVTHDCEDCEFFLRQCVVQVLVVYKRRKKV